MMKTVLTLKSLRAYKGLCFAEDHNFTVCFNIDRMNDGQPEAWKPCYELLIG